MTPARFDKVDGKHFILIDRVPVPANLMTWARWLESSPESVVAIDEFAGATIRTEFVGLALDGTDGQPLLFETVVEGGAMGGVELHHRTWADAQRGHLFLSGLVRAGQ